MKILFIFDYYFPHIGGAETLYQKLAEYFSQDHEVHVVTQQTSQSVAEEVLNDVHIHRISCFHRALFPYAALETAKELAQDADIIQATTYSSAVLASRLRNYSKAKMILLVHEVLGERWFQLGLPWLQAWLYHRYERMIFRTPFDRYIAISQSTGKQLEKVGVSPTKMEIIYNGVDNELFQEREMNWELRHQLGISDHEYVYLYAGRPGATKGVFTLLEAAKELSKDKRFCCVLILGKNPTHDYQKVKNFIAKNRLGKSIILVDSVLRSDLPHYLAIANVVVVPSFTEGFGFLAAEVSNMQIPMIVTNVDALPEVVSGQVIFIPSKSSSAIVAAVEKAEQGMFQTVSPKDFSWETSLAQYDHLYEQLSTT
ncbi:MAG: hypothetical protein A2V81_03150 [Candidatus Abawacabacteria bacterium RBG_16_42_10]|uniref:Glycosyltransferase subfamily 4-like N-terminal domain-containing protein n=1 Tax=Candidatus Abawacabacteria bacterium RBG_16_42_10 TaxID=1817814 RepID=A0A1F4XKH6_9BACT|nr:MAG: hypothetical protein A2V81_03150 [Candidatus Abawacabacteria bacterium RBG_16_42_10]